MKTRRFLAVTMGVLVLSVGLVLANYGGGVTPAGADNAGNNHTLRWDTNNPSASRFTTVFTGAVRDNNTGLVWEQAPDATTGIWGAAINSCVSKTVGGTVGWRLPSVVELNSVRDPSLTAPFVPASAFTIAPNSSSPGVQSAVYFSATTLADVPSGAWSVSFGNGLIFNNGKADPGRAWCVRGGMNADSY